MKYIFCWNAQRLMLPESLALDCKQFMEMIRFDNYFWLINCEDERTMQELASFVRTNLDM